jgi:DNA-binding transcriptional MerR regulator
LGRLTFIWRAKQLGISLREVAVAGDCGQTRRDVAEALRRKIEECQRRLTELLAFKQGLEECYGLLVAQEEACGGCAGFPAACGCLPPCSLDLEARSGA